VEKLILILKKVRAEGGSIFDAYVGQFWMLIDSDSSDLKHVLSSITDDLTKQIGGIRAIQSIEPSGDRSVRTVCEKYEELVTTPVTLVRIGDLNIVKKPWIKNSPGFTN
jgi:hypothetical protein